MVQRFTLAAAMVALGLGLAGCAGDRAYGGGYGEYADFGPAGYDDGYGGYGYGGYGYAGGFGWYDGFYYPGAGLYVYDRYRRPYRWTDGQRRYWQSRPGYGNPQVRQNWQAFGAGVRRAWQDYRQNVQGGRQTLRAGAITPDQFQAQRQDARQAYHQTVRQDYGTLRQQNGALGVATPHFGHGGGGGRSAVGGGSGFHGGGRGGQHGPR